MNGWDVCRMLALNYTPGCTTVGRAGAHLHGVVTIMELVTDAKKDVDQGRDWL